MSDMNNSNTTKAAAEVFDPADIEKNKTMAGLSYIIFFLPLLTCPESRFARFHANQSLILFITSIAGTIVLSLIPFLSLVLVPLFGILVFVLYIMGLINGLSGKATEVPIIGKFRLLK